MEASKTFIAENNQGLKKAMKSPWEREVGFVINENGERWEVIFLTPSHEHSLAIIAELNRRHRNEAARVRRAENKAMDMLFAKAVADAIKMYNL